MYEYFSSHFFHKFFFILLKIRVGFVESHDGDKGSLQMIKLKDTADDGVGIAEGLNQQSYKEVDHEGENV